MSLCFQLDLDVLNYLSPHQKEYLAALDAPNPPFSPLSIHSPTINPSIEYSSMPHSGLPRSGLLRHYHPTQLDEPPAHTVTSL